MEPGYSQSRVIKDDPPPFLKKWPRVYAAVLCYLVILICFLSWFSRLFRY